MYFGEGIVRKDASSFVNPWVRNAAPYSARHMDFAWSHPEIMRMMSNENPLPPSDAVLEALTAAAREGNLYPGSGEELRTRIAAREGADFCADNVVLGNGSTDMIDVVVKTFVAPGERVLLSVPTFSMYEARIRIAGGEPVMVPMTPEFYWDVDALLQAAAEDIQLIFICTPNNPIGCQIKEGDLRRLLDLGIPIFIDEAYFELENDPVSHAGMIHEYPHAIINRTMSKAFGLAGFRVGYLLAQEQLCQYFNRVKIPWNVSLPALAAAGAALQDEQDQALKRETTLSGRRWLQQEINAIPGMKAIDSEGNFVLIDASALGKGSEEIRDDMLARGVFIRPMSPHHMPEGYVRVTIGTADQNARFLQHFRAYVQDVS